MQVCEVTEGKRQYLQLLLDADPEEKMIDRYLDRGRMFLLIDDGVKAECVVTEENGSTIEIKNLAVASEFQKQGYGRRMIEFVEEHFRGKYSFLQVGTGDSPATLPFYEKCGFHKSYVVHGFFTDNYAKAVYDGGVLLRDMVYLTKSL